MKLSKLQFKKLFYPNKESYAILFQTIITFVLIGAILLTQNFITNFSNQKYSYLSDTTFTEEGEERYTLNDLPNILKTQEEKLKKYQSILNDKEMRSDINYWTSFYMKPNSVQAIGTYTFLISNHIKEAFHYTSNEEFIVDSLKEKKGLYISRYLSEKEQIQIGDFVTIYKDNHFNESFKCQIVGIYETKNEDIKRRIYCNEDLFAKDEIDKENIKFSVQYLFLGSKPLNTKQLQAIALNSSHTFYSKGIFLSEEKLVFDNFFKVADVYLYLSTGIMGISLFLLTIIKSIKSQEVYYIENIYYKNNKKILFQIVLKNLFLIGIGFFISTFILFLSRLILFAIFKFYFFLSIEYLILSLIEFLILILGSVLSFVFLKYHRISFKNV